MATAHPSLSTLPEELQVLIFQQLDDYQAAIALSTTSRHFHRVVEPKVHVSDEHKIRDLLWIEESPKHRAPPNGLEDIQLNLACFRCYTIRPLDAFALKHIYGSYAKDHSKELRRFCLDCGVSKGIYGKGSMVRKTDRLWYHMCGCCEELKEGAFCGSCFHCWECLGLFASFGWIGHGDCPKCSAKRLTRRSAQ